MPRSRKRNGTGNFPEPPGAPQSAGDTTAAAVDRDRIARRAYDLYLARGGADGEAMEDWLAAEREWIAANAGRTSE
jgi:hypothetical protein